MRVDPVMDLKQVQSFLLKFDKKLPKHGPKNGRDHLMLVMLLCEQHRRTVEWLTAELADVMGPVLEKAMQKKRTKRKDREDERGAG